MRRLAAAFLAACLSVLAGAVGCAGVDGPGGQPSPDAALKAAFDERARQVAEAWRGSTAGDAWRTGFVPLADLTVPPASGFPDDDTKQAFIAGWYGTRTPLPGVPFGPGTIRFPDGSTMSTPLISGKEAYEAIDQGDPPCPSDPRLPPTDSTGGSTGSTGGSGGVAPVPVSPDTPVGTTAPQPCTALTVTEVTLGETTIKTSRGDATVPAWLFTIARLKEPVARVAVAPSVVKTPPSPSLPPAPHVQGLVTAQDLIGVDGATVRYRLGVGACDTNIAPLFYETDHVVVVGGSVTTPTSGACIDLLKLEPVEVTLAAPLGARPVVDAANGNALTLTVR